MIIVYIILGIITACVVLYGIHNAIRADELDERADELDKYSVHLDERANRLAAEEGTLRNLYKELRNELDRQRNGQQPKDGVDCA